MVGVNYGKNKKFKLKLIVCAISIGITHLTYYIVCLSTSSGQLLYLKFNSVFTLRISAVDN